MTSTTTATRAKDTDLYVFHFCFISGLASIPPRLPGKTCMELMRTRRYLIPAAATRAPRAFLSATLKRSAEWAN